MSKAPKHVILAGMVVEYVETNKPGNAAIISAVKRLLADSIIDNDKIGSGRSDVIMPRGRGGKTKIA
jgi:hypothetical protein